MHALIVLNGKCTVEQDAAGAVGRVGVVIRRPVGSARRHTRPVLADGPVLAAVGVGHEALEKSVPRVPVAWKVGIHVCQVTRVDVLAQTRLLVCADRATLLAVYVLRGEVVGVDGAHDVEAVAVVGGDEDERLLERGGFVEVGDGGFDRVVEFKEFTEGTVVVEHVHHLVDARCLTHQEPTFFTGAGLEDVDGFEGHVFETGLVKCGGLVTSGRQRLVQVLAVDVAVEPFGHVGDSENTERLFGVLGGKERSTVLEDLIILLGELLVIILVLFSHLVGVS